MVVGAVLVIFAIGLYALPDAFAATYTVENAQGSSTPGCEPDCFIPATVTIGIGDKVKFVNNDAAAHTSTAGHPSDGPSGAWDSSLVMMGAAYTTPALETGEYPYFCMVHPWMIGMVIVNNSPSSSSETTSQDTSSSIGTLVTKGNIFYQGSDDLVEILGTVDTYVQGKKLTVLIVLPDGSTSGSQIFPTDSGSYQTFHRLGDKPMLGQYKISADYGGEVIGSLYFDVRSAAEKTSAERAAAADAAAAKEAAERAAAADAAAAKEAAERAAAADAAAAKEAAERESTKPKPILSFVDENQDPSHYVKRYINEPSYREWFDENFPDYKIWEGIGISIQEYHKIVVELKGTYIQDLSGTKYDFSISYPATWHIDWDYFDGVSGQSFENEGIYFDLYAEPIEFVNGQGLWNNWISVNHLSDEELRDTNLSSLINGNALTYEKLFQIAEFHDEELCHIDWDRGDEFYKCINFEIVSRDRDIVEGYKSVTIFESYTDRYLTGISPTIPASEDFSMYASVTYVLVDDEVWSIVIQEDKKFFNEAFHYCVISSFNFDDIYEKNQNCSQGITFDDVEGYNPSGSLGIPLSEPKEPTPIEPEPVSSENKFSRLVENQRVVYDMEITLEGSSGLTRMIERMVESSGADFLPFDLAEMELVVQEVGDDYVILDYTSTMKNGDRFVKDVKVTRNMDHASSSDGGMYTQAFIEKKIQNLYGWGMDIDGPFGTGDKVPAYQGEKTLTVNGKQFKTDYYKLTHSTDQTVFFTDNNVEYHFEKDTGILLKSQRQIAMYGIVPFIGEVDFEILIKQAAKEYHNPQSSGGGCLIATAAFGSEMAPQVQFLREIRDNTVMSTESGTAFMTGFNQFYYSFSPQIADYERENPVFKEAVKVTLTPLLTSLTLLNYVEIDSEEAMLGYGIGIILLNVGMYFVAPAVLIISLKKKLQK